MPTFVELAVNVPQVAGVFDYSVPPNLDGRLIPGHLVTAPFGQQVVQGIVIKLKNATAVPETKPVVELLDPAAVLTPAQLELARFLADQTLAPLAACLDMMLPPGIFEQTGVIYNLKPGLNVSELGPSSPGQMKVLNLLDKRGPLQGSQIDRALPHANWRSAVRPLIKKGLVTTSAVAPTTARPKFIRTVRLAVPPEAAEQAMPALARAGTEALARRQAVLRFLMRNIEPIEVTWVYAETGSTPADIKALSERGLILAGQAEEMRDPVHDTIFVPDHPLRLTSEQQTAWQEIAQVLSDSAAGRPTLPILLHGVTGSGKTELYLQAVDHILSQGRQAVILVPEIALTPQTVRRFLARFPGQVGLYHSGLSSGERFDTWRRARAGSLPIIIGPRSALFMPLPKLGLIVMDEFHDDSYYQSDPLPYYHTRTAAIAYARMAGSACILGSATPDVTTVYQASQERLRYVPLPNRILGHQAVIEALVERDHLPKSNYQPLEGEAQTIDLPPVQIVDMRQELQAGNRSIFSRELHAAIANVLALKQQAILFLNRRGSATYVFCRNCGHTMSCPRCELPLTLHINTPKAGLLCHHCGYRRNNPESCPQCHQIQIRHYGTGTEKVEAEVQNLFPQARTLRWDYETTRQKGAHDMILTHFANHQADILIGTQMLAKGLDLPMVTLVGLVLADVGLTLPDFRASERTFQLITQVAGRAGRSPLGGRVVLQTFQPDHYVIQAAGQHDYRKFYRQELEYRRRLGYPPFSQLVRLEFRHHNSDTAEQAAASMAQHVRGLIAAQKRSGLTLIGPAPCFFNKLGGQFRWQMILKGPSPQELLHDLRVDGFRIEVNPPTLL